MQEESLPRVHTELSCSSECEIAISSKEFAQCTLLKGQSWFQKQLITLMTMNPKTNVSHIILLILCYSITTASTALPNLSNTIIYVKLTSTNCMPLMVHSTSSMLSRPTTFLAALMALRLCLRSGIISYYFIDIHKLFHYYSQILF